MDDGAIARNVEMHKEALRRAAARNGNLNSPPQPPASVTGADSFPSRAVSETNPYVGTGTKEGGRVESGDAGMSWGKGGETQTTRERGAETIPAEALTSMAIKPQQASTTSPEPDRFDRRRVVPVGNFSQGNMNMDDIIGRR
jgi:hypothetical protein